jgi:octaprenyl-diphosphate synthase
MDLKTLQAPIADDLARTNEVIRAWLKSDVALINEVSAHILAAGDEAPQLLAAIIEFIHTATLLHDDVVDHSDRRRGRKTANAVWGNSGAVLCGDFLYSRSFQMMVAAGKPGIMQVMADTTNAIAEGEVLQLLNLGDTDVTEARYLKVIELKTARLFQAAAQIGAIAADQPEAQCRRMAAFGRSVGIAYQLVDDLLDYLADPETSGKNLGTDLAEGKPTLPLIRAAQTGTPQQSELIRSAIREGRTDGLQEVLDAVEATDAIPYTRALAESHRDTAIAALSELPESPYKNALRDLAGFAVSRLY